MKIILLLAISIFSLMGSHNPSDKICYIDSDIMFLVAATESHKKREIGYPFLISLNMKKDKDKTTIIVQRLGLEMLDNRSIDCKSKLQCIQAMKYLEAINVKDVDLGGYQINYKLHKTKLGVFFDYKKSYLKACRYLTIRTLREDKMDFNAIANYHSTTKKINQIYADKLKINAIKYKIVLGDLRAEI